MVVHKVHKVIHQVWELKQESIKRGTLNPRCKHRAQADNQESGIYNINRRKQKERGIYAHWPLC